MSSSLRSSSLTPESATTPRAASGKPRSASLPPARLQEPSPLRGILRGSTSDANRSTASPIRGILKKSSLQTQNSSPAPSSLGKDRTKHHDVVSQRAITEQPRPQSASHPTTHSRAPDSVVRPRRSSLANSEEDHVFRACDQPPTFPKHHNNPSSGCDDSSARSGTDGGRAQRPRANSTSVRKPALSSQSQAPSPGKRDAVETSKPSGRKSSSIPRLPFQIADYKDVMHDLGHLLHGRHERLAEFLDLEVFYEQKESEREAREHYLRHKDDPPEEENPERKPPRIYYMTVLEMMEVSSTTIVFNGYQHDLPAALYECVEELHRTGIYDDELFGGEPIKHNIDKMRRIFDHGYKRPAGVRIGPLAKFRTSDICGLFETILEHLPEPLIPRDLNYGLWKWCVNPVLKREWDIIFPPVIKRSRKTLRGIVPEMEHQIIESPDLTPEERRAIREEFDAPMVEIAQNVLRLLSVEHLSLLVYLFDFFKQVIAHPGNSISTEIIGEKFGFYLLGGTSYAGGRTLTVWLLDRWERISKGLLDITPPGTRRFVEKKPDLARRRAEEAHRRKFAPSPHQPYQEGLDAHSDEGEGSSAAFSDSASTFVNSSNDGLDDGQSASVLGYYLDDSEDASIDEHPRRRNPHHNNPRRGVDEGARAPMPKPRSQYKNYDQNDARRSRRYGDGDNAFDVSEAARRIAEFEREIQQSRSFRRLLPRRDQKPSRRREAMTPDEDGDDYSHYF
ncbi:uncharacterized protein B0H18DRAFT_996718 [Fomitopsis serialis]|uniref:uncharacterized protein n=1 Tax=Fomitopsis serialis TaxID=139415 RepID=UPI0020081CB9|nr:uncharacterized protein B0H18DRAFT_996718 [Neoantrodia serialis]KAH9929354.1 hypothetical protein B0H18DRAFT_996718 [Neoantrodia serialis]